MISPTRYANDKFSIKFYKKININLLKNITSKFKYIKLKAKILETKNPVNLPNDNIIIL
jgi:hypothetical protein